MQNARWRLGVRFVYVHPFESSCYAWHIIYEENECVSAKKEGNNLLPFYYYISAILLHQQINKEFSAFQLWYACMCGWNGAKQPVYQYVKITRKWIKANAHTHTRASTKAHVQHKYSFPISLSEQINHFAWAVNVFCVCTNEQTSVGWCTLHLRHFMFICSMR